MQVERASLRHVAQHHEGEKEEDRQEICRRFRRGFVAARYHRQRQRPAETLGRGKGRRRLNASRQAQRKRSRVVAP